MPDEHAHQGLRAERALESRMAVGWRRLASGWPSPSPFSLSLPAARRRRGSGSSRHPRGLRSPDAGRSGERVGSPSRGSARVVRPGVGTRRARLGRRPRSWVSSSKDAGPSSTSPPTRSRRRSSSSTRRRARASSPRRRPTACACRTPSSGCSGSPRGSRCPSSPGPPAPPLADAFRKHRDKFGRIHAPPLSHDFAIQRLDAPDAPLIWAELDGGREDLLYVFDGTDDPAEGLATLNSSESTETLLRRYLWLAPLSVQPIGRDPRDPPEAALPADGRRRATSRPPPETTRSSRSSRPWFRRAGPPRALRFDVDSIVYAQAGSNLEERFEKVRRVTDESGRVLPFDHRLDELVVALAEPAPAGQPLKLRFEIDGDFLVRPRGDSYWELGIWAWFPRAAARPGRPTRSAPRCASRSPSCRSRRARPCGARRRATENVLETRIDTPIQFAVILAGRYDMEEIERDGVTIRVATYALDNPRGRKNLMQVASEVIAYYQELPRALPVSGVQHPRDQRLRLRPGSAGHDVHHEGGVRSARRRHEPVRGSGDRQDLRARDRAPVLGHRRADPEPRRAVAGGVVRRVLLLALHPGPAQRRHGRPRSKSSGATAPASRATRRRSRSPTASGSPTTRASARRSATGFSTTRGRFSSPISTKQVGDEAFLAFLRSCQTTLGWKFGTTKEIARLLQAASGRDFMPFFEKYYWGVEMPSRPP